MKTSDTALATLSAVVFGNIEQALFNTAKRVIDYYGVLPHKSECAHAVAAAYQILLDTSVPSLSSHFL